MGRAEAFTRVEVLPSTHRTASTMLTGKGDRVCSLSQAAQDLKTLNDMVIGLHVGYPHSSHTWSTQEWEAPK